MEFNLPDQAEKSDPQCLGSVTEDNRLECLYEF